MARLAVLLFLAGACSPKLTIPEQVEIQCSIDADCPSDWVCKLDLCVEPGGNSAPSLAVMGLDRQVGDVTIPVTAIDPEDDAVTVTVEYSTGDAFLPATVVDASLQASRAGVSAELTWQAAADLGSLAYVPTVQLRLTPSDDHGTGAAVVSSAFAYGNDAPVVSDVQVGLGGEESLSDNILVQLTLSDSSADAVEVAAFEYSLAGDFSDAVFVELTQAGATGNFPIGRLAGLESGDSSAHSLVWASRLSVAGDAVGMRIRVRVADAYGGLSAWGTSPPFDLDNATFAPELTFTSTPSGAVSDQVAVGFAIQDADNDLCQLLVEVESDTLARTGATSSSPRNDLAPGDHVFAWESSQLVPYDQIHTGVVLYFTVFDQNDVGTTVQTPDFSVDNTHLHVNNRPEVNVTGPAAGERFFDTVDVDYQLIDFDSEPLDVLLEMSADGAQTWHAITEAASGSDGTSGLSSSGGPGEAHRFRWDVLADARTGVAGLTTVMLDSDGDGATDVESVAGVAGVVVRVQAADAITSSAWRSSAPFDSGNDAPVVAVSVPPVTQSDLVAVSYALTDSLADACDLSVSFSTDGTGFSAATVVTSVSGVLSSTGGQPGVLLWDSSADLPESYRGDVEVRVAPVDEHGAYGAASSTGMFPLRNNTPPEVVIDSDLSTAPHSASIGVDFTLTDAASDPCQIDVRFSVDGGSAWSPATLLSPAAGLESSPAGVNHTLIWDSRADLADQDQASVLLRITPSDFLAGDPVVVASAFRVDNQAPAVVSMHYFDDVVPDGDIDRVELVFDEVIAHASVGNVTAFRGEGGELPSSWDTPSGDDDSTLVLYFNDPIAGTAPVSIAYTATTGRITDLAGTRLGDVNLGSASEIDEAPPRLKAALAREMPPSADGLDDGDAVVVVFSESIDSPPALDAANIDTVLALDNGHSWLDGNGSFASADWHGAELEVTLSDAGGAPSLVIGDVVTPQVSMFADAGGNAALGSATIAGTFSRVWQQYLGFPPPPGFGRPLFYDSTEQRAIVVSTSSGNYRTFAVSLVNGREQWSVVTEGPVTNAVTWCAAFDAVSNRGLLFGSAGLWVLDLTPGSEQWSQQPMGSPSPTGRNGCSLVVDPVAHRALLFGGQDSLPFDELWALDLATDTWVELVLPDPPAARYYHSAVYDRLGRRMIIFGGQAMDVRNDLWALDLTEGNEAWTELTPDPTLPEIRYGHVAAVDENDQRMLVFGGRDHLNVNFGGDELWSLDLGTDQWTHVTTSGAALPTERHLVTGAFDPVNDRLVVFGGQDAALQTLDGFWLMDATAGSERWSETSVKPRPPPRMYQHHMLYDAANQRAVLVFNNIWVTELWVLDLALGLESWSPLSASGTAPSGRDEASLVYDSVNQRGILFGGDTSTGTVDETWVLELDYGNESWSQLVLPGAPAPRRRHTAVFDPTNERMFVFGEPLAGSDSNTYVLSTVAGSEAWSALATTGTSPSSRSEHTAVFDRVNNRMIVYGAFGDTSVYALDLSGSPTWSIPMSGGLGLTDAVAVYDAANGRMLTFAGNLGTARNALWELDLTPGAEAWTELLPYGALPAPRYGHAAVFDSVNSRLVIFGGHSEYNRDDTWWY